MCLSVSLSYPYITTYNDDNDTDRQSAVIVIKNYTVQCYVQSIIYDKKRYISANSTTDEPL